MESTLVIAVVANFAAAAVFAVLATTLAGRATTPDATLANTTFVVWWYAVALQQLVTGVRIVLVHVGAPLTLMVGLQFLSIAALCMGLAGLLYYLLYLYSGRSLVLWPLLVFYAAYAGWTIDLIARWQPIGLDVGRWTVGHEYTNPGTPSETLAVLLGLAGPQLLAVLGLTVLALRLPPSGSRLRVLVVAAGILVWFSTAFVGAIVGLESDPWHVVRLALPVLVGSAVLAIYRPPGWLRARLPPDIPKPAESEATPA